MTPALKEPSQTQTHTHMRTHIQTPSTHTHTVILNTQADMAKYNTLWTLTQSLQVAGTLTSGGHFNNFLLEMSSTQ